MSARKKIAIIIAVFSVASPAAYASTNTEWAVTGHTIFANMTGFDPCIAAVAGVVRFQVLWFNDEVLFERASFAGQGQHIYVVEHNGTDPRDQPLIRNQSYVFADPNNKTWNVTEYYYFGTVVAQPTWTVEDNKPTPHTSATAAKFHTWVVEIGNVTSDPTLGAEYNFVNLANLCLFTLPENNPQPHVHNGTGYNPAEGNSHPNTVSGTDPEGHAFPHEHGTARINLYSGKAPNVMHDAQGTSPPVPNGGSVDPGV
ncbi:MAG: hypothetical protein ACT4PT_00055 [Methanobacteriota archaeon]